ncbi:MAG: SLC45 family MFS transporter [Gammaproteobacteria bacterium]|nr:SLC45 family MFS transporter [Gammaproteobacteria bacterium]
MQNRQPELSFLQIWNMCFGFLGIQFGFALQNANVSRIFQSLGASIDELPLLWLAAPVTGLIVQPIIGYLSDRTWGRLGRRRPYFLVGALLATTALVIMPNSPYLWVAAGMLWILDASINVSMEPFRALVGDVLPDRQRSLGYSMQSWFIGVGAVVASALPWILANVFGVSNVAETGQLPESVKLAFYLGAIAFLGAVLWTVLTTKEYPPEQLEAFAAQHASDAGRREIAKTPEQYRKGAVAWGSAGVALAAATAIFGWDKELYVLGSGLAAFGLLQLVTASKQQRGDTGGLLHSVVNDLFLMPRVMKQLAVVQFLSWFALFAMWIYTTAAVTEHHFGTTDTASAAYNDGANWVGVLFAAYNGFAALAAIFIPRLAAKVGRRRAHLVGLWCGALGLVSIRFIDDPKLLLLSMVGIGVAWASILSLPYAMLSQAVPPRKMGIYMGIFNFFIVIPQILAATVLGMCVRGLFGGQSLGALALGGALMFLAGLATLRVEDHEER